MLLVVDVGNTQTHFATWEQERLVEHWRFASVRTATADEIGAVLLNLLELRGLGFADIHASIVSSTVPNLEPEWVAMSERYLDHRMLSVGPGLRTGMAIRYDNPREIGADRLVNAVAIRERFGGPAICVDFGTAVNFDVVSREGEYLGGVLMPGVEISLDALTERGAKLPKIDLVPPRNVIGKSTVEAIRAGVIFGYAAAVDGILRRIRTEMGEPAARTIATGGLAGHIVPFTEEIEEVDELLTLTGLRLVYERNLP
jgi:type III pantothenate kinase